MFNQNYGMMIGLEASHCAQRVNATGELKKIKYFFKLIFPLRYSGVEAKRGVEFRHSTLGL